MTEKKEATAVERTRADDEFYDDDDVDSQKDLYLTFKVGNEEYGIEILHVIEIVVPQKITEVPDTQDYVRGVINLRGMIVPLIDVRTRFKLDKKDFDERTCFVVVDMNTVTVGLVVDSVSDVLSILPENIAPPPRVQKGASGRFIKGMGKVDDEVKILLDLEKMLTEEEIDQLTAVKA